MVGVLKITVVMAAIFFIVHKLASSEDLNFGSFVAALQKYRVFTVENSLVLILLTVANWYFEIKKWQVLSSFIRINPLPKATTESLASFTAAIFTPSRIGEYGAKSLYYPKGTRKKVIFLNFLGNMSQMVVTVFFGILGLFYMLFQLELSLPFVNAFLIVALIIAPFLGYWFVRRYNWKIKGYSIARLEDSFKQIPRSIKNKTILYASLRYLIFTHQFYFLLLVFEVDIFYPLLISAVFGMYFLASLIPTMMIFDALIKGGFAVWIFGLLNVPEVVVLVIVLAVWILNFGVPGLLGSYYVLRFRPTAKPVVP